MSEETIKERLEYLGPERCREILEQVIESLVRNGDAVAASDILCENCLLTRDEAFRIFIESERSRP